MRLIHMLQMIRCNNTICLVWYEWVTSRTWLIPVRFIHKWLIIRWDLFISDSSILLQMIHCINSLALFTGLFWCIYVSFDMCDTPQLRRPRLWMIHWKISARVVGRKVGRRGLGWMCMIYRCVTYVIVYIYLYINVYMYI